MSMRLTQLSNSLLAGSGREGSVTGANSDASAPQAMPAVMPPAEVPAMTLRLTACRGASASPASLACCQASSAWIRKSITPPV